MKSKISLLTILLSALLSNLIQAQSWLLTGNPGTNPNINFIGTTNNKGFAIRTNNIERLRVANNGRVGIGLSKPQFELDVNGSLNIAPGFGYYIGGVNMFHVFNANNLLIGRNSGQALQLSGSYNTAVGEEALKFNSTGDYNTAFGVQALYVLDPGGMNTAAGFYAMGGTEVGSENCAFGGYALGSMATGSYNTGIGVNALKTKGSGLGISGSTAVGYDALTISTFGDYNTSVGYKSLSSIYAGGGNTALGGLANVNDSFNIANSTAIGYQALITASDQVRIGNSSVNSIGGYANWSDISDGRVKKNIKTNVPGLAFINKLKPITYNLNLDVADKIVQTPVIHDKDGRAVKATQKEIEERTNKQKVIYTGFIAQDVEEAAKALNYDFSGVDAPKNDKDLYALRYAEFVVPLVKAVQELSKENDALKSRLEKLEQLVSQQQINNAKGEIILSSARIGQNIPNPSSSGNTVINYYLPEGVNNAFINVSDENGKLIKSVQLNSKGNGHINVKTEGLAAGTYHYILIINGKTIDKKKMIVQ